MIPCARCNRFILADARRCPFCGASLRAAPSPPMPAVASVLLGLAMAACGGDSTNDDGASASMSATNGDSTTMGPGMTSTGSTTTGPPDAEASVAAYGGPDVDTLPPDEDTADGSTTDTGTTGTESGSESGTGSSSSGNG